MLKDHRSGSESPQTVYHYTSQAGLLGIVGTKTIWGSKIQYLNDASEYVDTVEMARLFFQGVASGGPSRYAQLAAVLDSTVLHEHANYAVASFSRYGDRLSQWRAYCPPTGGYSIGFRTSDLARTATEQGFELVECIYDRDQHFRIVGEVLTRFWEELEDRVETALNAPGVHIFKGTPEERALRTVAGQLSRELGQIACVFKNPAFEEEQEWRLVSATPLDGSTFLHRPGNSMIVPYVPITLDDPLPISGVYVGPTPHPELSRAGVQGLLRASGCRRSEVLISGIPYRNW